MTEYFYYWGREIPVNSSDHYLRTKALEISVDKKMDEYEVFEQLVSLRNKHQQANSQNSKPFFRTHKCFMEYCEMCGKFEVDEHVACEIDETSFGGDIVQKMLKKTTSDNDSVEVKEEKFPAFAAPPEFFTGKNLSHEFEEGYAIS